jgi:hypothetical protein
VSSPAQASSQVRLRSRSSTWSTYLAAFDTCSRTCRRGNSSLPDYSWTQPVPLARPTVTDACPIVAADGVIVDQVPRPRHDDPAGDTASPLSGRAGRRPASHSQRRVQPAGGGGAFTEAVRFDSYIPRPRERRSSCAYFVEQATPLRERQDAATPLRHRRAVDPSRTGPHDILCRDEPLSCGAPVTDSNSGVPEYRRRGGNRG